MVTEKENDINTNEYHMKSMIRQPYTLTGRHLSTWEH